MRREDQRDGGSPMKLVLEIDPAADPVCGTLCDERGVPQAFTGWTQLGAILDGAISGAFQRPAAPAAKAEAAEA
jgi:hypothetical protein